MRLPMLLIALFSSSSCVSCAKNDAAWATVPPKEASTTSSTASAISAANVQADPKPAAAASATSTDEAEIDRLVARLSASPLWLNGRSPNLDVPATAKPDEVLTQMFTRIAFDQGRVTQHTILTTKIVRIPPETEPYTAVAIDTNLGPKLVLMQHHGKSGFWTRVFNHER